MYNTENFAIEAKYRLQIALKHAKDLLNKSKLYAKNHYDKKMRPLEIKIGDKVLVRDITCNKTTDPMYKGPFVVSEIKEFNLILKNENTQKIIEVHKNNVTKYN